MLFIYFLLSWEWSTAKSAPELNGKAQPFLKWGNTVTLQNSGRGWAIRKNIRGKKYPYKWFCIRRVFLRSSTNVWHQTPPGTLSRRNQHVTELVFVHMNHLWDLFNLHGVNNHLVSSIPTAWSFFGLVRIWNFPRFFCFFVLVSVRLFYLCMKTIP